MTPMGLKKYFSLTLYNKYHILKFQPEKSKKKGRGHFSVRGIDQISKEYILAIKTFSGQLFSLLGRSHSANPGKKVYNFISTRWLDLTRIE